MRNSKTIFFAVLLGPDFIIVCIILLSITSLFSAGVLHAAEVNKTLSDISRPSQEQKEPLPTKTPRVLMRDSQTGYAVFPDEIIIIDTTPNKTVYHKAFTREEAIKEFKGGAFPTMPDLPQGYYKYVIQAKGYKPITSHFFTGSKTPKQGKQPVERQLKEVTFFLDPVETAPELKHDVLKPLSKPDSAVLVGFVVDDETGLPIQDATVRTEDRKISATTNDRGFFVIRFPLPKEYEEFPKINVIYEKEGYRSEEVEHYELMPGGPAMTREWLKPGKGKRIVDYRTKIELIEP